MRTGQIGVYRGLEYELILNNEKDYCTLVLRKDTLDINENKLGFIFYSSGIYCLDIKVTELDSAFSVLTFCKYNDCEFQLTSINNNNKTARIWPTIETQSILGDFSKHGYDPYFDVEINELQEIWEVREPLDNFKFAVDTISVIKV